jgi:hypothetical protein
MNIIVFVDDDGEATAAFTGENAEQKAAAWARVYPYEDQYNLSPNPDPPPVHMFFRFIITSDLKPQVINTGETIKGPGVLSVTPWPFFSYADGARVEVSADTAIDAAIMAMDCATPLIQSCRQGLAWG